MLGASSDSRSESGPSKPPPPPSSSSSSLSAATITSTVSDPAKRAQERTGFVFLSVGRMPSTIIMLTFFVPYLTLLAKHSVDDSGSVSLLFARLKPSSVPTGAIMIASALSAVFCPALGALADFSPHRRALLKGFAFCSGIAFCLGSSSSSSSSAVAVVAHHHLSRPVPIVFRPTWWIGFLLLVVMFFAGQAADFLANSYLAEVADTPGDRSRVSSGALRLGFLAQTGLLLVGMAVSYAYVPLPLQPNGSRFDCSTSNGFAAIRAAAFAGFADASRALTRPGQVERWSGVLDGSAGPARKTTDARFWVVTSTRIDVAAAAGSTFVAFSEQNRGADLHGRRLAVNAVVRPRDAAAAAVARVRVHLLTFGADGADGRLLSGEFAPFVSAEPVEHRFRLAATLPGDAHALYYVVEVEGGAVSITRLDVMDDVVGGVVPLLCLASGVWYLIWSAAGLRRLGERNPRHVPSRSLGRLCARAVAGLGRNLARTASDSVLARSLLAVAFYSASVGSTMLMGPVFITEKLAIGPFLIGLTTLATIATSIAGAVAFLGLGRRVGYNRALALAYLLWMVDMILMFFLLRERDQARWLFLTVPVMGMASGGSLTLARAVFASQIPPGLECELFGLFSFAQAFMGPFALVLFMAANEILGDLQWGIASQTLFMLMAFALQISIREKDIASRRAAAAAAAAAASSSSSGDDPASRTSSPSSEQQAIKLSA